MPLFVFADGASDSCMDQSRLQLDPGFGVLFCINLNDHPLSIQWAHGARELNKMLVFP